jgi:hypothetical protein
MSFLVPGGLKLAKLQRRDVQALIDRLTATLDVHTVRNAISPLRSICRHAVSRELIAITRVLLWTSQREKAGASPRPQRLLVAQSSHELTRPVCARHGSPSRVELWVEALFRLLATDG